MKKQALFLTVFAIIATMVSCEKPLQELNPTLDPQTVSIKSGETAKVNFTLNDVRGNAITCDVKSNAAEKYDVSVNLDQTGNAGTVSIGAPARIYVGTQFTIDLTFKDKANGRTSVATITVNPVVASLEGLNPTLNKQESHINSGETVTVAFSLNDVRGNVITCDVKSDKSEEYKTEVKFGESYENGTISIAAPALILEDTPFDIEFTFKDAANKREASTKFTVKPVITSGLVKFTEPANSFIVAPGAIAIFPTNKGNSSTKVAPAALKVEWQDNAGLFGEALQIGDGNAIVSFTNKEGNVVLDAIDDKGVILWSWHFWVVKDTPKDVTVGAKTFMDRNIGALNLDEKSELSVGVIYQYGRKDPFPGLQFTKYELRSIYDEKGQPKTITIKKNEEENNLENAIKNPSIFYNNVYVSGQKHNYSWITTDATKFDVNTFKSLWENSGKKSMYDPCPAGYKVASSSDWGEAKAETVTVEEIWDNNYVTFDDSAIGTNERYIPGNKKKVQFRGCTYNGLRLTISGEVNSNSTEFSFANCIGKALPTAAVWCSDIDPDFATSHSVSNFRGMSTKVNTSGNGNYDDISGIYVNKLSNTAKYNLNYAIPVRCVREK